MSDSIFDKSVDDLDRRISALEDRRGVKADQARQALETFSGRAANLGTGTLTGPAGDDALSMPSNFDVNQKVEALSKSEHIGYMEALSRVIDGEALTRLRNGTATAPVRFKNSTGERAELNAKVETYMAQNPDVDFDDALAIVAGEWEPSLEVMASKPNGTQEPGKGATPGSKEPADSEARKRLSKRLDKWISEHPNATVAEGIEALEKGSK